MSFRNRLALFLMVIIVSVQAATALLAYTYLRHAVIEQGQRELSAATHAFLRQLNFLSERVRDAVDVLALDFPLRAAIARRDHGTELSVLRNHGRRIGAARMMLVGMDGRVQADSTAPEQVGALFPFAALLESAQEDNGTALATLGDKLYWIVVVPVRAPVPIAYIAAYIPVDDALLDKLKTISSSPHAIMVAVRNARSGWIIAAHSTGGTGSELQRVAGVAENSSIVTRNGEEFLASSAPLPVAKGSLPVVAILDFPLEETLRAYRGMITPMLLLLGLALGATLAGATLSVRRLARPLEELSASARRIAAGDYTRPPRISQRNEVGDLADALVNMTQAISERETAMRGAIDSAELSRVEAMRANEAKSQFLANMSHELRTPLNAIVGFSEMLKQQILGPLGIPRYADYADDIHKAGSHLLMLVERMLDLAEAESRQLALSLKPASAGAMMLEAINMHRNMAEKSGVRIHVANDFAEWPQIGADAAKLRQAFANLVHNAIKFTPAGGEVRISSACTDNQIRIEIADTGAGLAPDQLKAVVRPFHRLRSALDGQHQGAGLGLPFAKIIIELHGGTLALASAIGKGTTVSIELPVTTGVASVAA